MSSGSSKDALDDAFQKIVIQMKPHVLQCTNEKGKESSLITHFSFASQFSLSIVVCFLLHRHFIQFDNKRFVDITF